MRTHRIHLLLAMALFVPSLAFAAPSSDFKVGVIAPLTGPVAPMGEAFRQGFQLFQKENPQCASSIVFEDGRYDGKSTIAAFRKLTQSDRVDLTIVWGNTPSSVTAPVAEREKAPLLAVAYTPEAKGRSYVVTFGPKTKLLSTRIAEEFRSWNLKRPAAIAVNLGNILEEIGYVKDIVGESLEVQVVPTEEQDFRSLLTRLKAAGVDGLLAFLLPDQAMNLAKQAAELQFTPPMIGADIFADMDFGSRAAKFLPRLAYVYSSVEPSFVERVKSELGNASYFYESAGGYTLGRLVCSLGERKEKGKKLDVMKEIRASGSLPSPIVGLKLAQDEDYGLHFENDARIYYLSGEPGH